MGWLSNIEGYFTGSNQRQAANDAARQLNDSKQETYGFLNPWAKAGGEALAPLTGLLTGNSYDYSTGQQAQLNPEQRQNLFSASPGYQFRLDQAMKAIQQSQAAKGNLLSGGALKELDQYSQGIAGDEYNNYLNQLFQLAGIGQQADFAKANTASSFGVPLAQAAFSSGIAGDIGANRMIQTALQFAGMGLGAGGSSTSSNGFDSGNGEQYYNPTSAGGGQYNSAMMLKALGGV
jgi:hypothetical protein